MIIWKGFGVNTALDTSALLFTGRGNVGQMGLLFEKQPWIIMEKGRGQR